MSSPDRIQLVSISQLKGGTALIPCQLIWFHSQMTVGVKKINKNLMFECWLHSSLALCPQAHHLQFPHLLQEAGRVALLWWAQMTLKVCSGVRL